MLKTIIVFLLFLASYSEASEFGMNVYGFSYHPDKADSNGNHFHSWNPGLGAQYTFLQRNRHRLLVDGGIYRNSSAHASEYVSGVYRFRLFGGFEFGPVVALYHSPDQNSGKAFIAPLLVLAYSYKRVTLQIVPVPKYKNVNRNAAIGMYFTIRLLK
jgi:hypothetical protein